MGELVQKQAELERQRDYYRLMWLAQKAENAKLQQEAEDLRTKLRIQGEVTCE